MGVILWYQIDFPGLGLKLSNDVTTRAVLTDAEISVSYGFGQPGHFQVHLAALPLAAQRALGKALTGDRGEREGGVEIAITLGYLESTASRKPVLHGRVDSMTVSKRFPPLGVRLSGYEEASFKLLTTRSVDDEGAKPEMARATRRNSTPAAMAEYILGKAGVGLAEKPTPVTEPLPEISVDAQHAFGLLEEIARRHGAELLVQDGEAQFGTAVTFPPSTGLPALPDPGAVLAFISGEESLLAPKDMTSARLAEFQPIQVGATGRQRVATDLPEQSSVSAFDFTVLGLPELRAGQRVAAGVEGYANPLEGFRILQLTHSFSPSTGYVCKGRAAAFKADDSNRATTEAARKADPTAIADVIAGRIRDERKLAPSVDVGQVTETVPDDRVASLTYGHPASEPLTSPAVDAPVDTHGPVLGGKPLASPFAWHDVGLSVPVYEGMRALLNQVRDSRDDAVVAGFLWANDPKMNRPKAKAGDWWLCLPTELSPGTEPRPTGKGVNDLTGSDGRRVVEAIGLKLSVGKTNCSAVGERPTEGPAEEFLLSHASGTELRIDGDGNLTVSAATGKTLTLSDGRANVTLADGEVTVTAGSGRTVTLSDGQVSLTVGNGKVAIT
ncbi:hypothetical protein [Streptomyces sp. A012304]|uniref:hypothetical protein n=1 Tax=Streptomyces sp. A012304 TaxID=375446 RepID=UPI002230F3AE|nr:hypothetical protein [Streptomyces sp. A012304]GKQ37931.1 hypothetical protein ALMP_44660 [Streptomyces sp. A012304]